MGDEKSLVEAVEQDTALGPVEAVREDFRRALAGADAVRAGLARAFCASMAACVVIPGGLMLAAGYFRGDAGILWADRVNFPLAVVLVSVMLGSIIAVGPAVPLYHRFAARRLRQKLADLPPEEQAALLAPFRDGADVEARYLADSLSRRLGLPTEP